MPATLVECLFIDNVSDAIILKDEIFRNIFAKATAEGLAKALTLPPKEDLDSYNPVAEIEKLKNAGLINSPHLPSDLVTWGEFSTVINRLLEKIKT
jgi:N-acetylmuramoyl-L-alanine amidase